MIPLSALLCILLAQPPMSAADVLKSARDSVTKQLDAGKELTCFIDVEFMNELGSRQRYSGRIAQNGQECVFDLHPIFDPQQDSGRALAESIVEVLLKDGRAIHRSIRMPTPRNPIEQQYELPKHVEDPFLPIAPPLQWLEFDYEIRESQVDPRVLLGARVPQNVTSEPVGGGYWVLTTTTPGKIAPGWLRRSRAVDPPRNVRSPLPDGGDGPFGCRSRSLCEPRDDLLSKHRLPRPQGTVAQRLGQFLGVPAFGGRDEP